MVIVPSFAPLHVTSVLATVAERTAGWVITRAGLRTITQVMCALSLIRTSYEPGASDENVPVSCHVAPPLLLYS